MSVSAHIVGDMTENRSFLDRPKPWLDAPRPGPTVVVDIDGVVADMHNFEGLIAAPSYADRDWKRFHTHFGEASLNRAGGELVRALDSAGFTIAYSTTRLDQFNRTSDRWIRAKSLPPGHIESRSLWVDGTVRRAFDVKRRHWWRWENHYAETSPIVAWIDDEPDAVDALRGEGCPAWVFSELFDRLKVGDVVPALASGPEPVDVLAAWKAEALPRWEEFDERFKVKHARWQKRHAERMRSRQQDQRVDGDGAVRV